MECKFSEATDVWSFGIVTVELYQDGAMPYGDDLDSTDVMNFLRQGERTALLRPAITGVSAVFLYFMG